MIIPEIGALYTFDVDGSLVRVSGRDITVMSDYGGKYEAQVILADPLRTEFSYDFVLHRGTRQECREFIKILGKSLVTVDIGDVSSTPLPENKRPVSFVAFGDDELPF